MKTLVIGSMLDGVDLEYIENAKRIGQAMAKENWHLVFGGSANGPVGEIYKLMKENGCKTTAIVPRAYANDLLELEVDESIVTNSLFERQERMLNLADSVIAIPGGNGTILELLHAVEAKRAGEHDKPIVLINSNGYFDDLIKQFEKSFSTGFAKSAQRNYFSIVDTAAEAISYINNYSKKRGEQTYTQPNRELGR